MYTTYEINVCLYGIHFTEPIAKCGADVRNRPFPLQLSAIHERNLAWQKVALVSCRDLGRRSPHVELRLCVEKRSRDDA
tara:strand:+ start:243 stop:479 length:237 start_codon:yes stop_codon:yes gene_type:complete